MPRRRSGPIRGLQELAAILSVQSLDLRAEYEAKLRILTDIQRKVETLRRETTAAQRQSALEDLREDFEKLTAANRSASETLGMIREAFDNIERGHRRPGAASATR
jgi:hypothetical protein